MEQIDISDIEIMGKTFGIFLFRVERPLHHFLHPSCANFHFSPTSFQALRSAEIERRLPSHQKVFDIFLVAFVRARVNTSVLRFETPNYGKMRRLWGLGAAEGGLEEAMPVRSCNSADAVLQLTNKRSFLLLLQIEPARIQPACQPASLATPSFIPRETSFLRLWPARLSFRSRHQARIEAEGNARE